MALIIADQRMPGMTGIALLEQARQSAAGAKSLLLTAYADTDVAIKAINDTGLDYYLLKPWDPPQERLFPIVDDLLADWRRANPEETSEIRVVGHRWSIGSHEVKTFLARNHAQYKWYDIERDAEAQRLSDRSWRRVGCSCSSVPPRAPNGSARWPAPSRFYTTKDVRQGSGLGLDIARRIVEDRHGGTIAIESQPGDTLVRVRLPIRPAATQSTVGVLALAPEARR